MLNLEPEIRHTCLGFQIYSVQGSHLHKSKRTGLETHVQAVEDWIGLDEPIFIEWQKSLLTESSIYHGLESSGFLFYPLQRKLFIVKACCIRELVWKAIQITSLSTSYLTFCFSRML